MVKKKELKEQIGRLEDSYRRSIDDSERTKKEMKVVCEERSRMYGEINSLKSHAKLLDQVIASERANVAALMADRKPAADVSELNHRIATLEHVRDESAIMIAKLEEANIHLQGVARVAVGKAVAKANAEIGVLEERLQQREVMIKQLQVSQRSTAKKKAAKKKATKKRVARKR